jgi:hypothetical protein
VAYQATCTRTYDDGEPCLGEIEDTEDGVLECSVCMAVSLQLVHCSEGCLHLTYEGSPGDTVLHFQTNNIGSN